MPRSSFLIQFYLLHSTLHKHGRSLFHLVAFSTLVLRDCPLGTKLQTLLLSSGGVQQGKTVGRMQILMPVCKSPVDSRRSIPSLHQPGPGDLRSGGSENFLVVCADLAAREREADGPPEWPLNFGGRLWDSVV